MGFILTVNAWGVMGNVDRRCLLFATYVYFGFAGLAPLASYSLSPATKSNQKRPPTSFAPKKAFGIPEFSGIANEPALMRRPGAQG
jgi:hypothetical protein